MKVRLFLLSVLIGVAVFSAAPAQPASPQQTPPSAAKAETPVDAQAEEIEIMRRLLERTLDKQQHTLTGPVSITNAAFSPDGHWLATSGSGDTSLHYWDATGGQAPSTTSSYFPTNSPYQYQSSEAAYNQYLTYYAPANTLIHKASNVSAAHLAPELRSPQGVYLKGYGVVYTATLALPTAPPAGDPKKPTSKPLTEWERTRMELRGEKTEPAKAPAPQETLADEVLKVLAKNGQHFSQLAETEQITVSLTLSRTRSSCVQCHTGGTTGMGSSSTSTSGSSGGSGMSTSGSSGGGSSTGTYATVVLDVKTREVMDKVASIKNNAQKAALLGDLHLKQGKNDQAAASLEEALKLYMSASEMLRRFGLDLKGTPEKDPVLEQELIVTATKLIQAYSALGKNEEVKKTLKTLDQHVPTTVVETPAKPAEAPPKVELPAKLVISAPKKLLDMVGSDKITFEEFRKNATIEYQPAKTIDKTPAKPKDGQ